MAKFEKGLIPWNKGVPCSKETKAKISAKNMGKKHTPEMQAKLNLNLSEGGKATQFVKGQVPHNKGQKNPRFTPEEIKAHQKEWRAKNKDKIAENNKKWRLENPDKFKAIQKRTRQKNSARVNRANTEYQVSKILRIPKWLTEDDKWFIQEAYDLAVKRTKLHGFSWHVDHIIPLKGKTVCGLHVPTNIQVIEGHVNIRKNNSFKGELFCQA